MTRFKQNKHEFKIQIFPGIIEGTEGYIDKIAEFLVVELNPEQKALVMGKSSFDDMKTINDKFSPIIDNHEKIDIVHKGKIGTGGDLFTEEQLAKIDTHTKAELVRLGSDFPYDEIFA